ncbi:ABC transporter substrate-binding protein [Camelimonas lactis]|uniref:NitT/TauT family transport system substrate-binding protein n=1 Tax=Camelimonas lactis TaxID=659006 RepID=A0A4R2GS86_9HYPH|nr:NrtA/SsuA/CpmA family ABC transporter substrate-binding protein [Camelimonas lactis]TCO12777.1 NitT/TauT family transport system substrate-binding protein [Camelimonas lactis]
MIQRRQFLMGAMAALAAPAVISTGVRAQSGKPVVIRMGALKLIHSIAPYFYEQFTPAGYRIDVVPFESPTEGKNAVVTKSVDFGMFGIAAGLLGASAGEPVALIAGACNKGVGVVAGKNSEINSIRDLKGKRVAIWPGSTQEMFILERLSQEGMSVKDITPVRISFSEMHAALARGDVDAYVGAEPGPGVSLATGVGKIVEYPYGTPLGALNMITATHKDTLAARPEQVKVLLEVHRKACEFAMANRDRMAAMAVAKLGQKPDAIARSVPNVDLVWDFTPEDRKRGETYAQRMLDLKQIRRLPDFAAFFQTAAIDQIGGRA